MSIVRTEINGSLTALKAALETLVPAFFASVSFDNDTTPTTITCLDDDGNAVFAVENTSGNWTYTVYKDASTAVAPSFGAATVAAPLYMYTVGSTGAVIEIPNALLILIAKTNTGITGFALPQATGAAANKGGALVGCWGDDTALTYQLVFTAASNASTGTARPMIGNQCLFVPIPMHGTYGQSIYMPKAFFMPMAQNGMRGVVQEYAGEKGVYLTNGYLALLDDSQVNGQGG